MKCQSCFSDVDYATPIFKEVYDEEGNPLHQVVQEHWCIPCMINLQSDTSYSIGVGVADDKPPK